MHLDPTAALALITEQYTTITILREQVAHLQQQLQQGPTAQSTSRQEA